MNTRILFSAVLAITVSGARLTGQVPAAAPKLEMAEGNLFKNPNFENGSAGWDLAAFGKKGTMTVDKTELHNGKPSLRIDIAEGGLTFVKQLVKGKPDTHYQLSGYIMTKDVEPVKVGAKELGACLMVGFTAEVRVGTTASKARGGKSVSIGGTNPWTKITVDFTSGSKTDLPVGFALGYYNEEVKGTAWYSELSLVELGPGVAVADAASAAKQSPSQPAPPAQPVQPALDAKAMQAMVIVEGDHGRGSAFIVKMEGKKYLVTNSHVVRGNLNVKFKNLRNELIATGPLQIADNVDAVRAEIFGTLEPLEAATQIEQKLKIGDPVVVAGNAEGEGVVREIPGKVTGIGPDRIEVDAGFVPGNSGSPILLKSTGQVIGVATYMKVPFSVGRGPKSPMSLNEVRRFGYRLDTVAKWISPQPADRLYREGWKLEEMDDMMRAISSVVSADAATVSKFGSSGFITKEKGRQSPALAAFAVTIDAFVKRQAEAKTEPDKKKNVADFFEKMKAAAADEVRSLTEATFSGYYAVQFKEHMAHRKDFFDFFDGTGMPAFREDWLASKPQFNYTFTGSRSNRPKIDPTKVKLVLTDHVEPKEPSDHCHHVGYPAQTQPTNLDDIYWVTEKPSGERNISRMSKTSLRVSTTENGTYRVYVEYRGDAQPQVISNTVEIKYTAVTAADAQKGK